jgi:hypothetical protein
VITKSAEEPFLIVAQQPAPAPSASKGPNTDRSQIYMTQPNGWTCGPTSLTMAAAAFGLRPVGVGTIDELVNLTGATPAEGIPNHEAIPSAARQIGLQSSAQVVSSPAKVRATLQAGHGVIQNGSLGSRGHYIYIAGLNADGSFIICDPARSYMTSWSDSDLQNFMNTEPGHDTMIEV